jgi:ferredoxin-NADP reductase
LKDELNALLGDHHIDVLSEPADKPGRYIDKALVTPYVTDTSFYYVCGPDKFTAAMVDNLLQLGIPKERIVIEE